MHAESHRPRTAPLPLGTVSVPEADATGGHLSAQLHPSSSCVHEKAATGKKHPGERVVNIQQAGCLSGWL